VNEVSTYLLFICAQCNNLLANPPPKYIPVNHNSIQNFYNVKLESVLPPPNGIHIIYITISGNHEGVLL
jgi:hypothetical protein